MKIKLSVSIVSFNEERNIARTLDAIKEIADEIVIVDSHSTDKTVEIAKSYGAKVYDEDWKGFGKQKNSCLEKCTGDWMLAIDCDEVLTKELAAEVKKAVEADGGGYNGFYINRKTFYLGKLLNYAWQPEYKLRLVNLRNNAIWKGYDPHDYLSVDGKTKRLKGDMIHYSYKNFQDHMQKTINYGIQSAKSYYQSGRKTSYYQIWLKPAFAFFKKFFLQRAFMDGPRGLLAAYSGAMYTYIKFSHLWELNNTEEGQKSKNA